MRCAVIRFVLRRGYLNCRACTWSRALRSVQQCASSPASWVSSQKVHPASPSTIQSWVCVSKLQLFKRSATAVHAYCPPNSSTATATARPCDYQLLMQQPPALFHACMLQMCARCTTPSSPSHCI
jgi:hypothetical protein